MLHKNCIKCNLEKVICISMRRICFITFLQEILTEIGRWLGSSFEFWFSIKKEKKVWNFGPLM